MEKIEKDRLKSLCPFQFSYSTWGIRNFIHLHPKTCPLLCACGCVLITLLQRITSTYGKVTCPHERQVPDNPSKQGFRVPFAGAISGISGRDRSRTTNVNV
jgi:hypothetical protein